MCNVGAAAYWGHVDPGWRKVRGRFRTKESIEDFVSLQFAVEDAVTSLILSETIGRESGTEEIGYFEDRMFQEYRFLNYMKSFGAIKPNIRPEDLLKKGMLDFGNYNLLNRHEICQMVDGQIFRTFFTF